MDYTDRIQDNLKEVMVLVRKAPATTKNKGSHRDETYKPGITGTTDVVQSAGDPEGIALDQAVRKDADKPVSEVMDTPIGGLNSEIAAPVNSK